MKLALLKNCSLTFDFCRAVFLFDDVWTIFQVKEEREWGMKVIICAYWLSWRIPTMHSSFSYSSHQLVGPYICQLSLWFFLWNYMWGPTGHLITRFMNNYVYCLMIRSGSFFLWLRMFQISPDLFLSFFFFILWLSRIKSNLKFAWLWSNAPFPNSILDICRGQSA